MHHWYKDISTKNIINNITLIYHSIDLYHSGKKIPLVLDYFNNILETLRSDDLNQITLAPNSNLRRYIFQVFFKKFFMDRIKQLHNMTSTLKRLLLWKCYTTIILCKSNSVTLLERLPTFLAMQQLVWCILLHADRVTVPWPQTDTSVQTHREDISVYI